jgi:predicted phage terminase large subunit-like protein
MAFRIKLPKFHDGQTKIFAESRRYNVPVCGRRFGKTKLIPDILLDGPRQKGALHGFPVALYAPTYQTMTETWREMVRICKPITKPRGKSEVEKRLELITDGVIEMWSLDNPDAGRGRKYATVAIDEAAMVRKLEEAWTQNIQPLLMDFEGEAWFLSTPKGLNYFHTLFQRGNPANPAREDEWMSWQMPTSANPYIKAAEIEKQRLSMIRLAFLQEIEAQFVNFAGTFIRPENIHTGQPPPGLTLYMGVDLAISMKEEADYTTIVILGVDQNGRVWVVSAERRRVSFNDAFNWIKEKAKQWRPVQIGVEAVQYQSAMVQELLRLTDLPVQAMHPYGKDKLTRTSGIIARYEQNLVWHAEDLPPYFREELLAFGPDCPHDDLVDAMVYAYMLCGDHGRSQIYIPEAPQLLKISDPNAFPGLPDHVRSMMYERVGGTCGACSAFLNGKCTVRDLLVGARDPACDIFAEKEPEPIPG